MKKNLLKKIISNFRQDQRPNDEKSLFNIEKILSNKRFIITISILVGILSFLLMNYIINLFTSIILQMKMRFGFSGFFYINFRALSFSGFFLFLYILALAFAIFLGLRLAYLFHISYREQNIGQKGTSEFTSIEEIKAQYKAIPDRNLPFPGYGGVPVARIGNILYIDDSPTNTMHIGITRSGKGEMFVLPEIDIYSRAEEKSSMVILDMKQELITYSYHTLQARGYDVYLYSLEDPNSGVEFNPLKIILDYYKKGDESTAELLCNSFSYSVFSGNAENDDNTEFFLSNATSGMAALILAVMEDCIAMDRRRNASAYLKMLHGKNLYESASLTDRQKVEEYLKEYADQSTYRLIEFLESKECLYLPEDYSFKETEEYTDRIHVPSVVHTLNLLGSEYIDDQTSALDIYMNSRDSFSRPRALYSSIKVSGSRTKGSIFSQMMTKLTLFSYRDIIRKSCRSTFDLTDLGFGKKPVALFIGIPFYDRSKDFLVSTLISQIFESNSRAAAQCPGVKCDRRIIFHLDEIGNYPAVKDFRTMLSVGLGINMIYNLFLQSDASLDNVYGKDAKIIRDNCGNKIYIQSGSEETAENFSKLLGKKTITNVTRTGKRLSLDKNFTEMYEERPLLDTNELMQMRPGETVVVRVMKRTDLKGNKVRPKPILNTAETGTDFKFRYEYLEDTFPSNGSIRDLSFDKVPNRDLENNLFNPQETMDLIEYRSQKKVYEKKLQEYNQLSLRPKNEKTTQALLLLETEIQNLKDSLLSGSKKFRYDDPLKEYSHAQSILQLCNQNGVTADEKTPIWKIVDQLHRLEPKIQRQIGNLILRSELLILGS